jgi:hypothetical protein
MSTKRNVLIAMLSVVAIGAAAGSASAETRWEHRHPRQDQVLDRDAHLRREIRTERREGELSRPQAHRLLASDRMIAREDHLTARANGGYITRHEQHNMNRQEHALARRIHG